MDNGLIRRVHDLPPELFEQIREEVLSYDPPLQRTNGYYFVHATSEYKLPSILQVDRSSRDTLSSAYLYCRVFRFSSVGLFRNFINSLSDTHFKLAAGFQAWYPRKASHDRQDLEAFMSYVHKRAHKCGVSMMAHFESALDVTVDGSPSDGTKQDVFVVWNQHATLPKVLYEED